MNMDIQYSLLAALVDEKKANIFDDIVVHIIEYVVSLIAEQSSASVKHHSTSSLQNKIAEIVGIEIPITIIRNAVSLISQKSDDVSIQKIGDKGNIFSIQRSWSASIIRKTKSCIEGKRNVACLKTKRILKISTPYDITTPLCSLDHIEDILEMHSTTPNALSTPIIMPLCCNYNGIGALLQ